MNSIKLYWSASLKNGKKNFGDWLSPNLCEAISKKSIIWAPPQKCDLAAVGSVLRKFPAKYFCKPVHIWGSGLLEKGKPYKSKHHYHAIRGQLSANHIMNKGINVLGDPCLLTSLFFSPQKTKKYAVGIIPHYKDQDNTIVKELISTNKKIAFIDVFSEVSDFIAQVTNCEVILSSSLHGLIVADTFNIPNAWISLSNLVRGDGFKFYDYYSAFPLENMKPFSLSPDTSLNQIFSMTSNYQRPNIEKIKDNLLKAFPYNL